MLKALREGLGRLVVAAERLTRPRPLERSSEEQAAFAAAARHLSLYHFHLCPFCIKTRRAIGYLNLPIELRDAQDDPIHRAALLRGGGKIQVPCLRIDEPAGSRFIYESNDIVAYLKERFSPRRAAGNRTVEP